MKTKIPPLFSNSLLSLLLLFILADVTYADVRNGDRRDGVLRVHVSDRHNNAPIKANIYIQLPNGVHIDKRVYTNRAKFRLAPGNYKVTVKAQYKADEVKFVRVRRGEAVKASFAMRNLRRVAPDRRANFNDGRPHRDPPRSRRDHRKGTLTMYLDTRRTDRYIRSRFMVHDRQGVEVATFYNTRTANVKLAPGAYTVTVEYRRRHISKPVSILSGRNSSVRFGSYDFNNNRRR